MITDSNANRSDFFKVIRGFLFAGLFIAGVFFCKPCFAEKSADEKEYKAQKKFIQLQSSVDKEDYMAAQLALNNFQKEFADTNFYKVYAAKTKEFAKKIKKMTKSIKVEDKIEYIFIPPRLKTKLWQEYMSKAEMMVAQRQGRTGIAVLRVIFEDETLERPSVRPDWNYDNQIYIYQGGGFSSAGTYQSGDAVFIGSERVSGANDKNISIIGDIIIGGLHHYPTKVKIEIQKGKAIAFGEIIVRSIPQKYCGNLKVNVEAEKGLELVNANVSLAAGGFHSGTTMPLKNNSCIFSSIGPGSYSAGLTPNNTFGSTGQSAVVVLGQTTEVTIKAYRHRSIELDWRFRKSSEPNEWLSGQKTIKTKEYWQPEEWEDVHYPPVVEFGDWVDDTCKIRTFNGNLMRINTNEPFEKINFPLNFSQTSHDGYPIREGDIFAWQRDGQNKGSLEALICIRKITPAELPLSEK